MIESILTVVGSGVAGSGLKMAAGTIQNIFDLIQSHQENATRRRLAKLNAAAEAYKIEQSVDSGVLRTRRLLALLVCGTFSVQAIYCTAFPDLPIVTLPGTAAEQSFLWGLYRSSAVEPLTVTTGALAYASVHFAALVLGFYFTPIGKR